MIKNNFFFIENHIHILLPLCCDFTVHGANSNVSISIVHV